MIPTVVYVVIVAIATLIARSILMSAVTDLQSAASAVKAASDLAVAKLATAPTMSPADEAAIVAVAAELNAAAAALSNAVHPPPPAA